MDKKKRRVTLKKIKNGSWIKYNDKGVKTSYGKYENGLMDGVWYEKVSKKILFKK